MPLRPRHQSLWGGIWVSQLFHSPEESPEAPKAITGKAAGGWLAALVRPRPHLLMVALTLPVAAPQLWDFLGQLGHPPKGLTTSPERTAALPAGFQPVLSPNRLGSQRSF